MLCVTKVRFTSEVLQFLLPKLTESFSHATLDAAERPEEEVDDDFDEDQDDVDNGEVVADDEDEED